MNTPTRALALITFAALAAGLTACNSGTDDAMEHDHGAHESGAAMDMQHEAAAAVTMKKIAPSADYPLTTCVVSGEALGGDMGDAIAFEVDGQEVQFCCAGCVDEFKESPEAFLATVRAAGSR